MATEWLVRARVPLGFATGAAYLLLARPTALGLVLGLPLVIAREAVRLAASGHIEKNRSLATAGPYARVRHPLYLGSGLLVTGFAIASGSPGLGAALVLLFAAVYLPLARIEEGRLRERFGTAFEDWRRAVPAFVPRLRPGPTGSGGGGAFSWAAVRRHREWRTVAGIALLLGFLAFRLLYTSGP